MSDGGPETLTEQEKQKLKKRSERAAEHTEHKEKTREVKKFLHEQKKEGSGDEKEAAKPGGGKSSGFGKIEKRSEKVEQHDLNEIPDRYGPETQGRISTEAGTRTQTRLDKSGLAIISNPESGLGKAVDPKDLPNRRPVVVNDNFVQRTGDMVEIKPRYPVTNDAIERAWRHREKRPLVDHYGRAVEMDPQLREHEKKMNKLLNSWYETHLGTGMSLSEADKKVADDALLVLKITIAPLVGLSI